MPQARQDDHVIFARFDKWWETIEPSTRASLDVQTARVSFVAGCRLAKNDHLRKGRKRMEKYRFQAGRWKVRVYAYGIEAAKVKAIQTLDCRAQKFMATAPRGGWNLSLIEDDQV
ncbi:hypothetical protein G6L37_13700 [Agrobacterium rubi]|uniref:hypothetical protein n=1 Tax=Agrobacterium rubi TaxID=28099 RepID=UPI0015718753|nr:hypothetical protein [Agrobacterium rubi]NTF07201.1 hypothetical protein [Agrobacterium rubi]NTF19457.1 hypothetical protein [Agrobacterium rubi]NTF26420.1 hypothetical protein [Agrobacterium rubi]